MIVNGVSLEHADVVRLKNAAKVAQDIENRWDLRIRRIIRERAADDAETVSAGGEIQPPDFESLFVEHYFETQIAAFRVAEQEQELKKRPRLFRLARTPRSLAEIMRLYDRWKKGLYKPKGPIKRAKELKDLYIKKVQSTWKRYSDDFRNGGEQTQIEVRGLVREAAETTVARAQTIVRTETTRYYNKARKDYYDQGDEVTHYLFLAVRDKATTPWCTSHTQNGKRGRSGLVYKKGDPLLDKETPPIHWNCRSELLPLNRFNPAHQRLIKDESIQRRNCVCHPLPPGWNK